MWALVNLGTDRLWPDTPLAGLVALALAATVAVGGWVLVNPNLTLSATGVFLLALAAFWAGGLAVYVVAPRPSPQARADRTLSDAQRSALSQALRQSPGEVMIGIAEGAAYEEAKYAQVIIDTFRAGLWTPKPIRVEDQARGLVVAIGPEHTPDDKRRQEFIAKALDGAGIPSVKKKVAGNIQGPGVILFVGEMEP